MVIQMQKAVSTNEDGTQRLVDVRTIDSTDDGSQVTATPFNEWQETVTNVVACCSRGIVWRFYR